MSTRHDRTVVMTLVEALELLHEHYGPPQANIPRSPTDELIMTILSQHTSDVNAERSFGSLRARFPAWDDAAHASVSEVANAIRCGGLANVKAPIIQSVLRSIVGRAGGYDLQLLFELADVEAVEWLTSMHGVGPKTAACVLLFSMGRPVMPVDTHVHRVSLRLGFVPAGTSALRTQALLERQIPTHSMYDAHMLLVQHGRVTCKARSPRCRGCVLASRCPGAALFDSQG